jgi:hypothetical protein
MHKKKAPITPEQTSFQRIASPANISKRSKTVNTKKTLCINYKASNKVKKLLLKCMFVYNSKKYSGGSFELWKKIHFDRSFYVCWRHKPPLPDNPDISYMKLTKGRSMFSSRLDLLLIRRAKGSEPWNWCKVIRKEARGSVDGDLRRSRDGDGRWSSKTKSNWRWRWSLRSCVGVRRGGRGRTGCWRGALAEVGSAEP